MIEHKQAGGYARAAALTPERRAEIARTAAQTRWAKKKAGETPAIVDGIAITGSICVPDVRPTTE